MVYFLGDETVILDLASGTYYGLDPVGARIWQLMAEGQTPPKCAKPCWTNTTCRAKTSNAMCWRWRRPCWTRRWSASRKANDGGSSLAGPCHCGWTVRLAARSAEDRLNWWRWPMPRAWPLVECRLRHHTRGWGGPHPPPACRIRCAMPSRTLRWQRLCPPCCWKPKPGACWRSWRRQPSPACSSKARPSPNGPTPTPPCAPAATSMCWCHARGGRVLARRLPRVRLRAVPALGRPGGAGDDAAPRGGTRDCGSRSICTAA